MDEITPKKIHDHAYKIRETDSFFASNDRFIRKSLESIYPDIKGELNALLRKEVEDVPNVDELRKRHNGFLLKAEGVAGLGSIEDYAKSSGYDFKVESVTNETVLKGQTGCKGKVIGKVRLLLNNSQVGNVLEEEIIVSPMTTPEHIPAMEKAAAFVTDEGGITCHAAIVAREMRKPCVIGTKVGTKMLKDGDMVEVDADNGIVRILK